MTSTALRCRPHRRRVLGAGLLIALGLPLGGDARVSARIIERSWTYAALLGDSDLVVIGFSLGTTDTDEAWTVPHLAQRTGDGPHEPVRLKGVETRIGVLATLRGACAPTITLHHYADPRAEDAVIVNGPNLASFSTAKARNYLLFLVKEPDGRYAPTGGQLDPASYGVHPLGGLTEQPSVWPPG